jgi:hypothetical protein
VVAKPPTKLVKEAQSLSREALLSLAVLCPLLVDPRSKAWEGT